MAEPPASTGQFKLYCVFVANDIDRTRDLHYVAGACPANGGACEGGTVKSVLRNAGTRQKRGNLHCTVSDAPIIYGITYDFSKEDGYQERVTAVKPVAFDWRGLLPNGWCVRDAWVHFDAKGGDLFLYQGLQRRTNRGKCEWEEVYDRTKPAPDLALPESLSGAWVEKGKSCPPPDNPGERAAGTLWIQPHAIDRADGSCWLAGRFNVGRKVAISTLCRTGKGFVQTAFTFDRVTKTSLRVRSNRSGKQTYTRCSDRWMPDPNQVKAASRLVGLARRFIFDIKTRSRTPSGEFYNDAHRRTFDLHIDNNGTVTDRMWIDDLAPKTFETRFGAFVVDSAGDRATWLVQDEHLLRVRERAGYYELVNWPLGPDGRSVACDGRMELIASRKNKKLYTIGTDGVKYEVLNFEWSNAGCPPVGEHVRTVADDGKKPPSGESAPTFNVLDYVPKSKQQSGSTASANDNDKCIDPKVEAAADNAKGGYSLRLRNTCPFDVVVRVLAESEPLMITKLPGSSGRISLGYHFPLSAEGGVAPEVVLEALEFAAMPVDAFKKSCPGLDVKQRDASLACFGKAYVSKNGASPDQPLHTAGNKGESAPKAKNTPALDINELLGVSKDKTRPPGVETPAADAKV
ncbi:MAG: hypothetical protein KKB37_03020, partial [Alphaproteobacteria bacterium]|nr:hypothetical protein [Alphaproteobacteria bacterium]